MAEARTQNVSTNAECRWCIDGLAEIGTRPEGRGHVEMFAPCPYCEAGARLEFPQKARGRWSSGYWQGRDPGPEVAVPPRDAPPLPVAENALRLRLLKARMGGRSDVDPCVFLDVRDAGRRLESLRGYVERLA